jgi:hypothetical protein
MPGRLIFEKRAGKADALIREINGQREEIAAPKQAPIPHDLFHVAVESVLQRRGFAHRFTDGEGVGYRMTHVAGAEAVERLVETMQADCWSGRPPSEEVIDLFRLTCAARGDQPFDLSAEDIAALRAAIDEYAARWAALAVGERLVVEL